MYEYQAVPFKPLKYLRSGGAYRNFTVLWLALNVLIIPSGLITRYFELTGVPFSLFGVVFHVTVYLPMIICIPICLSYGLIWAAIPAYFSTMVVALVGGMPLHWVVVFAFANPIGLAIMVMMYRITPVGLDLRTLPSGMFFVVVSFLSALSGSIGSFIWTYTNQVNLHDFFKVWQGWWLGGFLQSVLICAPVFFFFSAQLLRVRNRLLETRTVKKASRNNIKFATIVVVLVIVLYVWLAFQISIMNVVDKLQLISQIDVRREIQQATEVTNFPVAVFIFIVLFMGYFFFYFIDFWTLRLQDMNERLVTTNLTLVDQNRRMQYAAVHDALTGAYNRSYLFEQLSLNFDEMRARGVPFTFFMLDVDHFKNVNDTYGHQIGDVVLQQVARSISQMASDNMTFARFGGEEFCIVAPGMLGAASEEFAGKLVQCVRDLVIIRADKTILVTISVGFRVAAPGDKDIDSVVELADRALYLAKESGRDRYRAFEQEGRA